ncbi:MAG: hypoxanthine phosphoribosyltransferase [Planctomycetes bacterium]|nr:hypoxanthine phosphoribosyltransferase [Planctomycetota bacterium]
MQPQSLISAVEIQSRVTALGAQIAAEHAAGQGAGGAGDTLTLVAVMDGAFLFAADLARAIRIPDLRLHFVRASSYRGLVSSGSVAHEVLPDLAGRDVLVVDDILDTGRTLAAVLASCTGAARLRTCVLLDKPARRVPGGLASADYTGFTIADRFVVGYGLDLDGRYRHLPEVCTMDGI